MSETEEKEKMTNTKILIGGMVLTAAFAAFLFWPGNERQVEEQTPAAFDASEVIMYKNPGCQCCTKWADHLEAEGFTVDERPTSEIMQIKEDNGVSRELASCHTAIVEGYVVEGHVPVEDVQRLLKEKPEAIGLTVPGMPTGSPGMEIPGREPDNYDVLLIGKDGQTSVYASH